MLIKAKKEFTLYIYVVIDESCTGESVGTPIGDFGICFWSCPEKEILTVSVNGTDRGLGQERDIFLSGS